MLPKRPAFNKPERFLLNHDAKPKLPLSRDIANLPAIIGRKRAGSPDLAAATNHFPVNRAKLRRSRSACDLRQAPLMKTNFKPTLPSIPAKSMKLAVAAALAAPKSTAMSLGNRSKTNISSVPKPAKTETKSTAPPKAAAKRIPPYDYKARFNDLTEKYKVYL
jgi:kinesin family member C1